MIIYTGSDLCGQKDVATTREDMYGANIFTAQSAESLRASGFICYSSGYPIQAVCS